MHPLITLNIFSTWFLPFEEDDVVIWNGWTPEEKRTEKLQIGVNNVAFAPTEASFQTTPLTNCHGGQDHGTATCFKTMADGKQRHAPCKIYLLQEILSCVSWISWRSQDRYRVEESLAILSFWGYYRIWLLPELPETVVSVCLSIIVVEQPHHVMTVMSHSNHCDINNITKTAYPLRHQNSVAVQ